MEIKTGVGDPPPPIRISRAANCERACVCGGVVAQLDRLLIAAHSVEEGHAVTRHASLNDRGERACGQRSFYTSAASVLLLAP